ASRALTSARGWRCSSPRSAPRGHRPSGTSARSTAVTSASTSASVSWARRSSAPSSEERAVTNAGAARIDLRGGAAQVATGVAVLDHLLEELARAGGVGGVVEIAPGEPEAEVGRAGEALGDALAPLLAADGAGTGSGLAPADEALAMGVVEASGRPLVVSNADLTSTRAGGLQSDLAATFLDELADAAG